MKTNGREGRWPAGWRFGAAAGIAMAVLGVPDSGSAQDRNDFTFKRLRPPEPGTQRRIIVQIDPEEQARLLAAPLLPPVAESPAARAAPDVTGAAVAVPDARFAWFWERVPPGLVEGDGRFVRAMAELSKAPADAPVPAPSLQHMQGLANSWGTEVLKATIGTAVSPALVLAVIGVESAGRVDAISHAGAQGLMQLIPATAERFGVDDAMDPAQNIRGGVAYLDWLMRHFDRDPLMVLAAYNAGEGAVRRNGGVPPFAETRDYVPKVLAAWQVAQGLCVTPPELMTDPCVFRVIAAGG